MPALILLILSVAIGAVAIGWAFEKEIVPGTRDLLGGTILQPAILIAVFVVIVIWLHNRGARITPSRPA